MFTVPRPLRTLFRTPLVTLVAILSLALGIGANAAIFSLFDRTVLRPLPVPDVDRLVNLSSPGPKPGAQSTTQAGKAEDAFSYPMFRDLQRVQRVFAGIAGHRQFSANLAFGGETSHGSGMLVSGTYFPVLGLQAAVGRLFTPADEGAPGSNPVVVLSYRCWQDRFHGAPAIVNQTLIVNGQPLTVVGVAPDRFEGTTVGVRPEIYVPLSMRGSMDPGWKGLENRQSYWLYLFARLRPGVTLQQAQTSLGVAYHAIVNEVEVPLQRGMSDRTMAEFKAKRLTLEDGRRGQSLLHAETRPPLLLLLAVTGLVLLIACANIANLLLARGATRSAEMAIRLSIGASRRQLVTQLLAESCLLAALGGLLGILVARWTLALIGSLLPPQVAATLGMELDGRVLVFAAILSMATGLLFGLFPALHSTRANLVGALKDSAGQPAGARSAKWFRLALATAQITLSMTLLVCAGLFTRSLVNVSRIDVGIRTENMVKFAVAPELNGYKPAQSRELFVRLEGELRALPGVGSATAGMVPLFSGSSWGNDVSVQGYQAAPDSNRVALFNKVAPDFFRTLGMRLLAGREFTGADADESPQVAVVNEAFARKFNMGTDVVGKRMALGDEGPLDIEIVGLVQDAKYASVKRPAPPTFYLPYRQDRRLGSLTFYVRTTVPPEQLMASVRSTVKRLDPNLPVTYLETMEEQVRSNVFTDRILTTLSAAFAALATLLAGVGLYGVLAYTVAQRTREIGLRMALGADATRVRGMVMRQVAWMTVTGGLLGLAVAVGVGRLAKSLLFEVQGHDPTVLVGAGIALGCVALAAGFIPAHRASRIDPIRALRYE